MNHDFSTCTHGVHDVSEKTTLIFACLLGAALLPARAAAQDKNVKLAEPIDKGLNVFTCGHSFHEWVPGILTDLCKKAGIKGHNQIGRSSIGGSKVIQHWNVPDGKNKAKEALESGKVDVLTLSPIFLFTDELGHGTAPLRVLVAYVNYAVIYRKSPIGLPVPGELKGAKLGDQEEKLKRLLQELAWDAVLQHPLGGVRLDAK